MAHGISRPVHPETGRPLDFDQSYDDLDLPPRRPSGSQVAPVVVGPDWAEALRSHAYLIGVAFSALGTFLVSLTGGNASIGLAIVLCLPGAIAAAGAAFFADAAIKRSPQYRKPLTSTELEASYLAALEAWRTSRPLVWLAQQAKPLLALRGLMAARKGSLVVGVVPDTQELYTIKREQPLLVMASGQLGKTSALAIPMVMAHQGPAVVTSTKDDVIRATSVVRASQGKVWVFDPAGSWIGRLPPEVEAAYWTPVWNSRTWAQARQNAEAMIKATAIGDGERNFHWRSTAKLFLAPSLLAASLHRDLDMVDILNWVTDRNFEVPAAILMHIAEDKDHPRHLDARVAWRSMRAMLRTEGEHADGIYTTLKTLLSAYDAVHFEEHQGRQNFDPAAFVRSTDTVYIASRSSEQADFAPVIVAFIDAIQQAAYDYELEDPFHSSERPSLLMCLDEVANCAPMRDLPRYLSEAGGQGVQIVAFIQSLSQVRQVWPDHVEGFFNFFLNIAAFGGITDTATLSALSTLTGDYDRLYVSNSFSMTTSRGVSDSRTSSFLNAATHTSGTNDGVSYTGGQSFSVHKERRLTEADIATLPPRHALVVSKKDRGSRNRGFSIVELVPYYESPWNKVITSARVLVPEKTATEDQVRNVPPLPEIKDLMTAYFAAVRAAQAAQDVTEDEEQEAS